MVVNAAGLPLSIQASPVALGDLIGGLSPGDLLRGRVVELLPKNQALVSLRGQNVVAQLPSGTAVGKGSVLSLAVSQADAGGPATPASLLLRLLGVSTPGAPGTAGGPVGSAGQATAGQGAASTAEQALLAAKLPATALNLSIAETLVKLGASPDPAALSALSSAAQALVSAERGAATAAAPDPAAAALAEGSAQIKLALGQAQGSGEAVALRQALALMQGASSADASALGPAVAGILAAPGPESMAALAAALEPSAPGVPQALPGQGTVAPSPGPSGTPQVGAAGAPGSVQNAAPGAVFPAEAAVVREALAQWLGPLASSTESVPAAWSTLARGLAAAYADPASPQSASLLASARAQGASGPSAELLAAAGATLERAAAVADAAPLAGLPGLRAALAADGFPVPAANLATLPPATLGEAVAWLGARSLAPQRPLVESVTAWIVQGRQSLSAARQALESASGMAPEVSAAQPGIGAAVEALSQALAAAAVDPGSPGLVAAIQGWASRQGLTLEGFLASARAGTAMAPSNAAASTPGVLSPGDSPAGTAMVPSNAAAPAPAGVRQALLRLESELGKAAAQSGIPAGGSAPLDAALRDVQAAVRASNAVPLQAQPAPAFDTLHLTLPVWMGGALGDGHISVTWRQGRDRTLNEDEPVTVAVALDTEGLGPVGVRLQVWKSSAMASVTARDEATARFLKGGEAALREGFARETPFDLRAVEFHAGAPGAPARRPPSAGPAVPGLSLSA